jgi:hypothetical protein
MQFPEYPKNAAIDFIGFIETMENNMIYFHSMGTFLAKDMLYMPNVANRTFRICVWCS